MDAINKTGIRRQSLSRYDDIDYKAPIHIRIAAKMVSKFLAKSGLRGFQGVAELNWDCGNNKVDVIMPTEEAIQFILWSTGERKSVEQVRKEYKMYRDKK